MCKNAEIITKNVHSGVAVFTTAQLHLTKTKLRFCVGSNSALGMLQICNGHNLRQWSWLKIKLNTFLQSTIPQKQFIVLVIFVYNLKCV